MKNNRIILAGKASLAAVMAASLVTPATAFAAEEPAPVVEETETQELLTADPVIEETEDVQTFVAVPVAPTPTPTPTPTPEGGGTDIPEAPKSSLPQANQYAPGHYGESKEELKLELGNLISEVEATWKEKGGLEYYKNNMDVQSVLPNLEKAKKYLEEGLSTAKTFSWRVYNMESCKKILANPSNVLTPKAKEIYALNTEKEGMDSSLYSTDSWKAYEDAVKEAMGHANGSGFTEERLQEDIDNVNAKKAALKKLDPNLVALNALVEECDDIVYYRESNGCTREAWDTFTAAYNEAASKVKQSGVELTPEEAKALLDKLSAAKAGLVATTPDGEEAGIRDEWKEYYATNISRMGGYLYVSGLKKTAAGTEIEVTFINNGLDPVTGKKFKNAGNAAGWTGFNGTETTRELKPGGMNDFRGDYILDVVVNNKKTYTPDDLTKQNFYDGFKKTILVPKEAGDVKTVDLDISQWNSNLNIPSLGTYYAPIPAPTAEVTYSEQNATRKSVIATITTDLPLDEVPAGWEKVSETVYTREYTKNGSEKVTIKANGKETVVDVVVSNIVEAGGLEEAIKGAETVKPEDYVKDENWNKFQEALKKAEEVLADETATQDEVDAAIKALNEAKANLKKAEDKKEEDKKDTNTAVGLNAGLFATLMGSSALGAAVLESLKRKNRK